MKEQLIEMGFIQVFTNEFHYELETCTLVVESHTKSVLVVDAHSDYVVIAQNATIEQISNILKSIQI